MCPLTRPPGEARQRPHPSGGYRRHRLSGGRGRLRRHPCRRVRTHAAQASPTWSSACVSTDSRSWTRTGGGAENPGRRRVRRDAATRQPDQAEPPLPCRHGRFGARAGGPRPVQPPREQFSVRRICARFPYAGQPYDKSCGPKIGLEALCHAAYSTRHIP